MLKKLRVVVSILVFSGFLLAFSGLFQRNDAFVRTLAGSQLIPSFITYVSRGTLFCLGVTGFIILSAVLFGRVYCSGVCPLGILQDIFIYLRFKYRKKTPLTFRVDTFSRRLIRYGSALLVFISVITGASLIVALLDPYSLFGKIVTGSLMPSFAFLFNKLSFFIRDKGYYGFPLIHVQHISSSFFAFALTVLASLGILSFMRGRWFCNYLCPAGALLGVFSGRSLFKITLSGDACTSCGVCERTCKGECISSKAKTVDNERCVRCFNCLNVCSFDALSFRKGTASAVIPLRNGRSPDHLKVEEVSLKGGVVDSKDKGVHSKADLGQDINRRGFIRFCLAFGSVLAGFALSAKELLATKIKGIPVVKKNPVIIPPGAKNLDHFNSSCTSCGICSANCPTSVISMSMEGTGGLENAMKPVLDYNHNYCLSECNACSLVCPTGALEPVPIEDKKLLQLGEVHLIKENCLAWMDYEYCTVCEEYCPTKAVHAIKHPDVDIPGHTVPAIDTKRCIGCGACEFMCPAQPAKAIYIEGKTTHTRALPALSEENSSKDGLSPDASSRADSPAKGEASSQEALEEFPF
jgi:ferredoxin